MLGVDPAAPTYPIAAGNLGLDRATHDGAFAWRRQA